MIPKKSKDNKEIKPFEKDYNNIVKDFHLQSIPIEQPIQWAKPGDFLVKFSLYQETPNSITSTDTTVNL